MSEGHGMFRAVGGRGDMLLSGEATRFEASTIKCGLLLCL